MYVVVCVCVYRILLPSTRQSMVRILPWKAMLVGSCPISCSLAPEQDLQAPVQGKIAQNKYVKLIKEILCTFSTSPGTVESSSPAAHSIPSFQHPSHSLLKANGFQQQQYYKYRHNCLKGTYMQQCANTWTSVCYCRPKEARCWSVSGDEYTVSLLVIFPSYSFQ